MQYMSVKEAAEKWGVSVRRVQFFCSRGRIPGISRVGKIWLIPEACPKPQDPRRVKKSNLH